MKTSKKFIAGISAFMVAVSSVAITVSAVNTDETSAFNVSISSDGTISAGNEVTITVDLQNVPEGGIAGFEFAVDYDASVLEFKSVTENAGSNAGDKELELVSDLKDTMVNDGADYSCFDYYVNKENDVETGKIACLWATGLDDTSYWINSDGTLATFTFIVKDDVTAESAQVGIVPILDGGEIVFAGSDDNGTYFAYDNVKVEDAIQIEAEPDVSETTDEPDVSETTDEPDVSETTDEPDVSETTGGDIGGSETTGLLGDVNVDGKVNGKDLMQLKKYILGLITQDSFTTQGFANGDVNGDTKVNGKDLIKLKKFILGLITDLSAAD